MKDNDKSKPNNSLNSLNEDNNLTACSCPERLFRVGDIVQEVRVNGRRHGSPCRWDRLHEVSVVITDEANGSTVDVLYADKTCERIDVAYLKLVIPVEERSFYYVRENTSTCGFEICRAAQKYTACRMAYFWSWGDPCPGKLTKKEAFDCAEADCKLLNEELIRNPWDELKYAAALTRRSENET